MKWGELIWFAVGIPLLSSGLMPSRLRRASRPRSQFRHVVRWGLLVAVPFAIVIRASEKLTGWERFTMSWSNALIAALVPLAIFVAGGLLVRNNQRVRRYFGAPDATAPASS